MGDKVEKQPPAGDSRLTATSILQLLPHYGMKNCTATILFKRLFISYKMFKNKFIKRSVVAIIVIVLLLVFIKKENKKIDRSIKRKTGYDAKLGKR